MKSKLQVHFSSKAQDWATPQALFDKLNERHGPFDLDVCATSTNAKCPAYCTLEWGPSGLECDWSLCATGCWVNPPYGRGIGKWMEKAAKESQLGCKVVCLIPARTDTKWWYDWVLLASSIEFLVGRVKFDGGLYTAPFPSAVAVYDPAARGATPTISWVDYR